MSDTGSGGFLGITVTADRYGDTAVGPIAVPQQLVRLHDDLITVASMLKIRSMSEWENTQEVFDAPRLEDGPGSYRRKRFGCDVDHSSFEVIIEFNGEYDVSILAGVLGTVRRTMPNGAYWEGEAKIVRAVPLPNHSNTDETMGALTIQWRGGKDGNGDHTPAFTAAA